MTDHARLAEALSYVPADNRETWVHIAMATKSALGEAGFSVWNEWSKDARNYNERDARAVWKSVRAAGGIGPGTLYAEAIARGWDGHAPIIDPAQDALRRAQRAAEDKAHAERQLLQYAAAARRAEALIAGAQLDWHPYLARKGFPLEKGFIRDTDLMIPMRCAETRRITSLQFISPTGEKLFLPKGRARGAVFALGTGQETYLCEGYATGLSVREALKSAYLKARVIVCFSAGNLAHVAGLFSGKKFVIADNDASGTGQKAASNTGVSWWMPPMVGMDANDYFRAEGVQALVNEIIQLRRQ